MHAKTRPEPKPLAPPAPDWPETRSTIDQNPAKMAKKTITGESHVGAEDQVFNTNPALSDPDKPGVDEDSYNPPHCVYPSWIQQLEQGVADYEKFIRWVEHDPSRVYYTIVSAQAEYEILQQQTVKHANDGLEAHRARAVAEGPEGVKAEHSAGYMKARHEELKMGYDCMVGEASNYAEELRRLPLQQQTRTGPKVVSIETPNQNQSNRFHFAAESVEGEIEPRISKSTLPDPEKLDDGLNSPFESWLLDMQGKLFFNADHYPTEKHKMIYIAAQTTGAAHVYWNAGLRQDAMHPYTKAQDMFDDLEWRFGDRNDATEACNGLDRPKMKPTDDFHTFLCMFLYKSGANRTRFGCLKNELYDRLTYDLKRAVMPANLDNTVTFDEFTKICGQEDRLLGHGYIQNKKWDWKKVKKVTSRAPEPSGNMEEMSSALATGNAMCWW